MSTPRATAAADPSVTAQRALLEFRAGFSSCLTGWADAAFELTDAALCAPTSVSSVPALSLEPVFRRSHGSLYKALARGGVDAAAARDLLAAHRPRDWPPIFAVDASPGPPAMPRPTPERGFYYSASTHSAGKPIVAGWSYQWIAQLGWANDSWTAPTDARRIAPTQNAVQVTATQIRDLVGRLEDREHEPVFVFNAGYDPIALTPRTRQRGRHHRGPDPRGPGLPHRPHPTGSRHPRAASPPRPSGQAHRPHHLAGTRPEIHQYRPAVRHRQGHRLAWAAPQARPAGTLGRSQTATDRGRRRDPGRGAAPTQSPTSRTKKTLWLGVAGSEPDLDTCWRAYLRRFDIEHTFRFVKNTLGWTTPSVRTPEQADRWTWLVIAAYTQLRLARPIVEDLRMPWERQRKPGRLTPARVRRGFRRLAPILGTPASPPNSRSPGPGRPKGTRREPRTRYPAIKKAA